MAKHMTKDELLRSCRELSELKRTSNRAPWTAMSTLCNWLLWKEEHWYRKKLVEYNQRVMEYDRKLDDGELELKNLQKRLNLVGGFEIGYVPETYAEIKVPKSKGFRYELERRRVDANNNINDWSIRYLVIHFNVLMDMGYGYKRLNRVYKSVELRIGEHVKSDVGVMAMHRELINGLGIYIEMPKKRG